MQSLQKEGKRMTTTSTPLFNRALRVERDNYYAKKLVTVAEKGADSVTKVVPGIYKATLPASVWAIVMTNGVKQAVFIYHSPADRDDDLNDYLLSMRLSMIS